MNMKQSTRYTIGVPFFVVIIPNKGARHLPLLSCFGLSGSRRRLRKGIGDRKSPYYRPEN